MLKKFLFLGFATGLTLAATTAQAQATLGTSPYTENFDNLATGLPTGFSVYTNASATSLGTAPTAAQLTLAPGTSTAWGNATGAFKNFASATGLTSAASTADQTAATNRALGVRQTGAFGDGNSILTPPTGAGPAFVFQVNNTTGKTDFALTFKLQSLDASSPRIATWQVDYGTGATPATFTAVGTTSVTGNSAFTNNTVTVSFGTALDNQSGPVYIRIVAPTSTTGSNNRPSSAIDDFSLSWNAPTPTTPSLTVTPGSVAFGNQNTGTTSVAQSYSLAGTNLTAATALAVTGPFTISKDNTSFGTTLSYTAAELATAKSVYVRFTPAAAGSATGSISHTSTGAVARTVDLTGIGTNPNQTVFPFATCASSTPATSIADGWSQYSVTGAQTWACTTFGRDPNAPTGTTAAPYGVQMNGYASGNVANEDWFISPSFNLSAYNVPLLQFWSRTAFNGPGLKLRVSTNYTGVGAPSTATWTDLNVAFPALGSDTWTQSAPVNLSGFKNATVYVAFVYTSTTGGAARWTLDDIALTNGTAAPAPLVYADATSVPFGYQAVNTSGTRTLTIGASDLTGNVTLTSSNAAFALSKDGTTFAQAVTLTPTEVNLTTSKAVTVRFTPTTASAPYAGTIAVASAGAASSSVAVSGDTYDPTKTLEVANWNIEWFGSTASGLGPNDKALQQANATTILTGLAADVYGLAEIVDTVRFRNMVAQLSANTGVQYGYKICDFGSYADDANDPDYAGDQKLAFIYRKGVVQPLLFQGLLRCTQATACAAYTPWASGRFPYLMAANVTLDGVTKRVNFIVIHAKANATATSPNDWQRRKDGADLLKTYLDTTYPGGNTLIVGDFNDVLNGTIATGVTPPVSSYITFLNDVANYTPLTLALANAGAQSTASYATVIDNVIASKPMANYYLSGSAAIRTDLAGAITSYASTTSDHYPVFTRYSLSNVVTATAASNRVALGLYPNPATNTVRFEVPETGANLSLQVHTIDGRLVLQGTGTAEQLNQQLGQRVGSLGTGLYLIQVVGAKQTYISRFQKQ
ncbi:MAG: T9SS type A sorting domain-containing protein [Hymenobacter sp.]|nr:MAG: T9SS type A sorting domain-containing protein [Hymenobacter sp.]